MTRINAILGALLCLLYGSFVIPCQADEWNEKTIVTFSEPVEVPGAVLPPGKYVFKLADSQADRHIVQIMNAEENHIYATVLAIPSERMRPTGKTEMAFYEMPAGQPKALKTWFYPGNNIGQEFAYPKARASEIAQVTHENVPSAPEEAPQAGATLHGGTEASANPSPAPAPAERPGAAPSQPVETAQANRPAEANPPAAQANPQAETTPLSRAPERMPRTASPLPLVAGVGILLAGAGLVLRRLAKGIA
jgi:hypothetical protein